jgi:hypothetical protein
MKIGLVFLTRFCELNYAKLKQYLGIGLSLNLVFFVFWAKALWFSPYTFELKSPELPYVKDKKMSEAQIPKIDIKKQLLSAFFRIRLVIQCGGFY